MPQSVSLVARSVHWPPHVSGALAGHSHVPALHTAPPGQAWPHIPQWSVELSVSTQRAGVPQLVSPVPHAVQRPPAHVPSAPQLFRHAPQFATSVVTSTQPVPHVI